MEETINWKLDKEKIDEMKLFEVYILFLLLHSSTIFISHIFVPNPKLTNNMKRGANTLNSKNFVITKAGSKSIITFIILSLFSGCLFLLTNTRLCMSLAKPSQRSRKGNGLITEGLITKGLIINTLKRKEGIVPPKLLNLFPHTLKRFGNRCFFNGFNT